MANPAIPNSVFFENYSEALLITGEDDTPVFINDAFKNLTGFKELKQDAIRPAILFRELTPADSDKNVWETYLNKHDHSSVPAKISCCKIALGNQSEGKVYSIQENFSATEIASLKKELAHVREELEQFIYAASHDLQEPLRMIVSYIQLIQKSIDKGKTENLSEFMHFVTDASERLQLQITDLLQLSRVNRKGNTFTKTNIAEAVKMAQVYLTSLIKDTGTEIKGGAMPEVQCDSSQIARVFQNLIDNAIKYRKPDTKPEIEITGTERNNDYLFSVKDNGIGIADKYHDRIFGIFQKLHPNAEYPGTGIGLAVCKKIVQRHGGEIWVESETGKGSTFYFTLKK